MVRPTSLFLAALFTAATFAVTALQQGEDALIQRKYRDAAAHLEKALQEEPAGKRDRVLLLLGRAWSLAGETEKSLAAYQRLRDEHQGSLLVGKGRFQEADVLAAAGRHREAVAIYRELVEKLIGLERKEDLAATYLGLAEKALGQKPPDEKRAVTFFDLALDLGLSSKKAQSVKLQAAEALLRANDAGGAIQRLTPLVKELDLPGGKLRAMLALGRARRAANDMPGARAVLRDLIALDGRSEPAGDAAYEIALTYGVPAPQPAELDRAVGALQALQQQHPAHAQSRIAGYLIARCYQHVQRSEDALKALHKFLAEDRAELGETAFARAMVGDVLFAQGRLEEAIQAWRGYLKSHPAHQEWERVQRAIVDAEWKLAADAMAAGKERYGDARTRFDEFMKSYPLDPRNPDVLGYLGDMLLAEEKYDAAREAYARCVSKYPGKEASSRAQYQIGWIYESKTFHYVEALKAYRAVTWGGHQGPAQQRIALLERKHLALLTRRSFRTGEKPSFQLTSRNIESVRVRVYKLDLETYFRSTHGIGAVERLDIEVIQPDQTFESKVPEYAPHKETEREVELGAGGPGAYVVKVDDKELEATTMVLVTDVALICKTSRHELFVFSQNVKEDRVESGIKVVVSDSGKVLAEGTTGADGVWRWKGKELQNLERLAVFAVNAAGSGASSLDLSGLGYSAGLVAKGYLFTDRPAYQPGQVVHVKGIVREVRDGLYQLPQLPGYRVQVLSASGRLLLQRAIQFTDFGSFAADLLLPEGAELGEYRVLVQREGGSEAFSGGFEVARYERPRLMLKAIGKQAVVFRGEKIVGRFELRYFFGEPAQGRVIQYALHLPSGALVERTGTTNAAGEVEFEFDTNEFGEEAIAVVGARVLEENAATTLAVPVVTTEFAPAVSLLRPVYVAGETFEAKVTLQDRSGKPLQRAGAARLLRAETRHGQRTEVEVQRLEFQTGADGVARVSFKGEKGGEHLVRVESKDRFGTLVTAQAGLFVSGDDDEIKLRLLGDRQSYKVGEKALVKVVNRAGRRLALRTIQGDGILQHDAIVLPQGESSMELELLPLHAPNFALALAMIDGQKLRTAERELEVARDLQVTVQAPKTGAPGGKVEVTIECKDSNGAPAAAEVALSIVDESLLALYPDRAGRIAPFFYGHRRQTEFRTVSSCEWNYRGAAQRVDEGLLAEERRAQAERERARAPLLPMADAEDLQAGQVTAGEKLVEQLAQLRAEAKPAPQSAARPTGNVAGRGGARGPADKLADRKAGKDGAEPANDPAATYLGFEAGGTQVVRQFRDLDSEAAQGAWIGDAGLLPNQPRTDFSESGGWVSSIVTGQDGKGTCTVTLPHSTTTWKLVARAATKTTDVGDGEGALRTQKDLQADLVAPLTLSEGDRAQATLRFHNLTERELAVRYELSSKAGPKSLTGERSLTVAAHREGEQPFPITADGTQDLELALEGKSGELVDRIERRIPVAPFGMEYRDGRAGRVTERERLVLSLPEGREYQSLQLQLELAAADGRDLLRMALGAGYQPAECKATWQTNAATAQRGIAVLLVLSHLERAGLVHQSDQVQLRAVAHAVLGSLLSLQHDDGGYAWISKGEKELRTTAQALHFLTLAQRQGFTTAEPAARKAADWLLAQIGRTQNVEDRGRAALALALADRARFEDLNALHRARGSLSTGALARLALAWQEEDRKPLAGEALAVLRPKLFRLPARANAAELEAFAQAAVALLRDQAADPDGARLIDWLVGQRVGAGFLTGDATAAAVWALTVAGGGDKAGAAVADVAVVVNGHALPASLAQGTFTAKVPAEWLKPQQNALEIQLRGRGVLHYVATLSGYASGFRREDRRTELVQIERYVMPAWLRHDGKAIAPGFGVVTGSYQWFRNTVSELPAGQVALVQASFWVKDVHRATMTPLVVQEPIPAGCTVPRASIQGSFDHVIVEPDRLTFYYREGRHGDNVRYELHARFPGEYRVAPLRVSSAQRPDLLAHGEATSLTVLARDGKSRDQYRMTPDELFQLGKALFDKNQLDAAGKHLEQLLDEWHRKDCRLRDETFKEVARMMLYVAIERKDSKSVVRFFEELKDRYQDLVIPFDKIVAVGTSYIDLGEFERASMVFRATAESSFLKDAAVATTLEQMGEVKASVAFLDKLLWSYPDLNTIRLSLYGIGQKLAAIAAGIQDGAPVDDKVGKREEIRQRGIAALREFLILYPDDPLAEEVSFAWATTLVEARDMQGAVAVAEAALARYPQSAFEDELLYTVGSARFALGEHQKAFEVLERVATGEFSKPGGGKGPSENQNHAVYLQGQIHHALGRPQEALALYEKVKDLFSDATEASDYFLRKSLTLPEVTSTALKDPARLTLGYRNLKDVELKVFKVDLMRLYLLRKSLNDIEGIQLHGISPLVSTTLSLGDGRDYRGKEKEVVFELKEPGAYLVVARGEHLLATGMLLRSDLKIEAQEALDVGRIRVNVKRGDVFLSRAHVKVIGAGDRRLQAGDTDLRGVFTGSDLVGAATVIVQSGDEYAFFRGEGIHQPARFQPPPQTRAAEPVQQMQMKGKEFDQWHYNVRSNDMNRQRQVDWLKNEVLNKQQKGVDVYRTK
jgi:hypothetical protein